MRARGPILVLTAVAGLSAALVSLARADDAPLISKRNTSGFGLVDGLSAETCTVYDDHALIVREYGGVGPGSFTQRERRNVSLSRGVRGAIRGALEEKVVVTPNQICDAPTTIITLGELDSKDVLFASGGCGRPRQQRMGTYSEALRAVVDTYCPTTHDFPGIFASPPAN